MARLCHLAMDLCSQPQSLWLLFMDKEPMSYWGTLCSMCPRGVAHSPKARWVSRGSPHTAQPQASDVLNSSVVILCDILLSGVQASRGSTALTMYIYSAN